MCKAPWEALLGTRYAQMSFKRKSNMIQLAR